jgi:MFS family permease
MLCQAGMGVVSIWGNIVIYIVSKFHVTEEELTTQFALIVFPTTYAVGSIAMQLGSYLMDRIHPRLQMSLGMVIFALSIYCAQFATTFTGFLFAYSVCAGTGFGIVYFLPVLCAWSYFPGYRNLCAGTILCCFSLAAIMDSAFTTSLINPENEKPTIRV